MGKADVSGKWLLGEKPDEWVRWVLADPSLKVEAFLSAEFRHVLRLSDVLLRVRDDQGPFLLLIELQLHHDPEMPWRMQAYAALAEERYRLPAYPLVMYLMPSAPSVRLAQRYYREFRGLVARRDFRVVKAWELDAREVVERGPLALVPPSPLMKGGADEALIRAGAQALRERGADEELEVVLALFASFVMDAEQIQKIVRWEMNVLRESPWYQEIVQEGRQEGLKEGRRQGLQKGLHQGLVEAVLHLLRTRLDLLGSTTERLAEQLYELDGETLHQLLVYAAQVESLDEFQTALDSAASDPD